MARLKLTAMQLFTESPPVSFKSRASAFLKHFNVKFA